MTASTTGPLAEIASLCGRVVQLNAVLSTVLRILSERLGLHRGTVILLNSESDRIEIIGAHKVAKVAISTANLQLGEGIAGQVIATGKPSGVVRIQDSEDFVDWSGLCAQDLNPSYACVPILSAEGPIGALGGYRLDADTDTLEQDLNTLTIVSGLLAPLARRQRQLTPILRGTSRHQQPGNILGSSKPMRRVYDLISQVSGTTTTVLLRGESGTGKELVAQALHKSSRNASGSFVEVNCAALPEGVIESELFGHERGAFTGAIQQRKGRFERARGGTIFLDEIGDLSPSVQVKLLRVLQERAFERIGGQKTLQTDARIVSATSRDLETMIEDGTFRADLYYRLNVFPIWLPPLRERKADILMLANHFIQSSNRKHGRRVRRISTSAIDMLMAYHWPGNVRELENCIERAVLLAREGVVLGHHLPPTLQTAEASDTSPLEGLQGQLDRLEQELILDALKSTRGNMSRAARMLGISERIMGLRIKKHQINPRRFKPGHRPVG